MLSIIYIGKNIYLGRLINVHVMNDVSNDTKDLADIDLVKYREVTRAVKSSVGNYLIFFSPYYIVGNNIINRTDFLQQLLSFLFWILYGLSWINKTDVNIGW